VRAGKELFVTITFADLGLSSHLLSAVAAQGYTEPTPIQQQAIPAIIQGRDILASAQTGTGKTAGFTLPILHRLSLNTPLSSAPSKRIPRVLILAPTRELAAQVGANVTTYGQFLPYKTVILFGGVSFNPQVDALRRGAEILVATPGRLLDHVRQGTLDLSHIQTVILDEADRMLDMGFVHDLRAILSKIPTPRQTLMFSATFSKEVKSLSAEFLLNPQRI